MFTLRSLVTIGFGALVSLGTSSAFAAPFSPVIDEFWIVKNGNEIFRDSFGDGVPPPAGPDGAATYGVFGPGGIGTETNGRLTLTPSLGDPVVITTTFADVTTTATRLLSTNTNNATNAANFLGEADAFAIYGLFDLLALPADGGQAFGIKATDRAPGIGNPGNNAYHLIVGYSPVLGENGVALRLDDYTDNSSTLLAFLPIGSLLGGADQIELILEKAAGSDLLNASFNLYDRDLDPGSQLTASSSIGAGQSLQIYLGEDYIRAQFDASDRIPIPAPATLPLIALGLAARRGRSG
jgi:hypothetical protein